MATLADVLVALESIAPKRFAFSSDRIGLQVGDPAWEVRRGVVTLDRSLGCAAYAKQTGANLIVSHHPLIWEPLRSIDPGTHQGETAMILCESRIGLIAAHTNWDAARGGINDTLASRLGLKDVKSFGSASPVEMLKLVVFSPKASCEAILEAVTTAGAGVVGNYDRCANIFEGVGTFRGGPGSHPTIGQAGQIEAVPETRLEVVLPLTKRGAVVAALRAIHPYEEPAYDLIPLAPLNEMPMGRIGHLEAAVDLRTFARQVDGQLGTRSLAWGDGSRLIRTVAVVGGAADGEWRNALESGADVFVTGEVAQHVALEASESGLAILSAGHYATEHPGCETLREVLASAMPAVEWSLFEPDAGKHGRPL